MSDTMKAVRNHGPRDYRLEQVPIPSAGPGEVVIRVDASGICGSDGKCFTGGAMFWGDPPWVKAPVTPGHEFFGTVTELGEGAAELYGLELGDKAIAEQILPCGACRYCQRGQYWMCEVHNIYGFQGEVADGAWADYMKFHAGSRVFKVPSDMPLGAGVLIEPLACAIHAVERANIQLGDTVVLAGVGTLGLLMLQVIALKNPGTIIVQDTKPERLELARSLGAHVTIDVRHEDPAEVVKGSPAATAPTSSSRRPATRRPWSRGCRRSASSAPSWSSACSARTSTSIGRSSATARSSTSSARTSGRTATRWRSTTCTAAS
jgi:erythritol/L-threitol dehydrogenase